MRRPAAARVNALPTMSDTTTPRREPAPDPSGPAAAPASPAATPATTPAAPEADAPDPAAKPAAPISAPVPSVLVHRPGSQHVPRAARALSLPHPQAHPKEPEAGVSVAAGERPGSPPWTRMALALAVCGPALWLGGVPAGRYTMDDVIG